MPDHPPSRGRSIAVTAVAGVALAALCALGFWRRLLVVSEYRNFAGDGWQYFHLAETLVKAHRYAFGPSLPPASSRLPGYPIFLALVGRGVTGFVPDQVAYVVARTQALLDVATAVVALLLAREAGHRVSAWLAAALCLGSPLLALSCSYLLSETLATLLTTTTLWLLLRATLRGRLRLHLGVAGALVGAGMLVRADAIALVPLFLVPLACGLGPESARERLRAAALAAAAAAAVYAPWPVRNVARFHRPHFVGSQWVTRLGDPLPTGVQSWLRTWAVDPREPTVEIAWRMTRGDAVYPPAGALAACDSPDERKEVERLFVAYGRAGRITDEVDAGFSRLADARRRRRPLRYYLGLPLGRARRMWLEPVPDWELPIQSPTLGLPARRAELDPATRRTVALALVGLGVLCLAGRRGRRLALVAATALGVRTALIAFAVPGGTQRYLFELWPLVLTLAAVGLAGPAELTLARLRRARTAAAPLDGDGVALRPPPTPPR